MGNSKTHENTSTTNYIYIYGKFLLSDPNSPCIYVKLIVVLTCLVAFHYLHYTISHCTKFLLHMIYHKATNYHRFERLMIKIIIEQLTDLKQSELLKTIQYCRAILYAQVDSEILRVPLSRSSLLGCYFQNDNILRLFRF